MYVYIYIYVTQLIRTLHWCIRTFFDPFLNLWEFDNFVNNVLQSRYCLQRTLMMCAELAKVTCSKDVNPCHLPIENERIVHLEFKI